MGNERGADFEEAIAATKFGFFNILLYLVAFPSTLAVQLESIQLAYILPVAHCDLNLSLENKGMLNAVGYAGMLTSAFFAGFLIDVFGRRKMLIVTFFAIGILAFLLSFATNLYVILAIKYISGVIVTGTGAALPSYISEFHGKRYRTLVPLLMGSLYSVGNTLIPFLAWAILPIDFYYNLFNIIELHAWNLFLFVCAFPPIIAGIAFIFLPESPKYLMTEGKNQKALKVFKKIHAYNLMNGKDYQIEKLADEDRVIDSTKSLKNMWRQILPLFQTPYFSKLILVSLMMCSLMMSVNTIRLWLPQIFQAVSDYENENVESSSFCSMIESFSTASSNASEICTVDMDNDSVYINSSIIGAVTLIQYFIASSFINRIGKRKLLIPLSFISGLFLIAIYFATSSLMAVIFLCISIGCNCICVDIVVAVIIDVFPTTLRASAISITFLCGRLGSFTGNLVIPYLLQIGCGPPFFTIGFILFGCTGLSLLLPNTHLKSLE